MRLLRVFHVLLGVVASAADGRALEGSEEPFVAALEGVFHGTVRRGSPSGVTRILRTALKRNQRPS
jgi:hypothetical protein